MNFAKLMSACARAFMVSLVLTPIIRDIFRAYNVVDRPGFRKVHRYPIPRVGGVPIASAYVIALLFLRGTDVPFPGHWVQSILSGAIIIFFTGLIDDFLNMKPLVKLAFQILAAAVAWADGISITSIGTLALPPWISLPLTVFWLLLTTNALNLIDGLDGLCAGVGVLATLTIFASSLIVENYTLAFTTLPLAAAMLGFLFFNFNPATVFLGDSGALLIGFLLGCFGIVWTGHDITAAGLALPLAALSIPLLDLASSIVRRTLKGQSILAADRGHMHHRLLDSGLTVRRSALTLYSAEITGGFFGVAFTWLALITSGTERQMALLSVTVAGILAISVWFRYLRYAEFEVAGNLLFGREFRGILAQRLRMRQLADALSRAQSGEQWWQTLAAAARQEQWIRLRRMSGHHCVSEEVLADRRPSWTFVIGLPGGESIEVEGDGQTALGSSDLMGLSRVLSDSARTHPLWARTAIS